MYNVRQKHPHPQRRSEAAGESNLRPWQTRTHCCGHIVADTNVSPFARTRNICCGHKFCVRDTKMFLILFRNILCPQQMFPSLRSPRNIMGNNVPATMCPRLPGPLWLHVSEKEEGSLPDPCGHYPVAQTTIFQTIAVFK